MTKTEARSMAASLNHWQKYALRHLLQNGEEARQTNGRSRLSRKDCRADYHYRRAISTLTNKALARRGLVTSDYSPHLTPNGVKVARILFSEWLEEYEERPAIETEAEGIVFKPTTVEEYVAGLHAEQEREERDHKEQIKRAVHLWRSIRLPEPWAYGSKSPWMAAAIKYEFDLDRRGYRTGINLDLEKLIYIGEQIEELRKKGGS